MQHWQCSVQLWPVVALRESQQTQRQQYPHTHTHTHTHTLICKAFRLSVSLNAQCQLCRDYTGSWVDNCNKTVQLMKAGLRLSTRINSAMLDTQTPPHLHFRIKLDAFMATRRNILSFRGCPLRVNFVWCFS